nr:MAG TPA: hypothetical protein [Caudoviricetes sp.]
MGFKHTTEALGCRLRFRQFLQGLMGERLLRVF